MPLALLASESEAPTYMPMYGANAISNATAQQNVINAITQKTGP